MADAFGRSGKTVQELYWVEDLPLDLPVYVYGGGRGGGIVRAALERAGRSVSGYLDSVRAGEVDGLPLYARDAFLDQVKEACVIVIASQHHAEIAAGLADRFDGPVFNAYPLISRALANRPPPAPPPVAGELGERLIALIAALIPTALMLEWPLSPVAVGVFLAYALFGVLILEAVLRVVLPRHGGYYLFRPHSYLVFTASEEATPGIDKPARFLINSLGLRSDEPPADREFTVYVFGGSTVVDYYLDQDDCWTRRLQAKLNAYPGAPKVWVGNLGRPAVFSIHNQLIFDHALPDLPRADLFVNLIGLNDMHFMLHSSMPRHMSEAMHMDWAFGDRPAADQLWRRSFIIRAGRALEIAVRRRFRRGPDEVISGDSMSEMRRLRRRTPPDRWVSTPPDLTDVLASYRHRLRGLTERAAAYGAPMVFMTAPTLWRPDISPEAEDLLYFGGLGPSYEWPDGPRYFTVDALRQAMEQVNRTTLETTARLGAPCIDLARLLPKDPAYFYDDAHFSTAGADRVAQLTAERLIHLITERRESRASAFAHQ